MSAPKDKLVLTGGCHCGAVRFEATLPDGFDKVRRCNCSFCRMRGAVAVAVPSGSGGVLVVAGEEALSSYRFNTGTAEHFFCCRCGIYTHHQRRSSPDQYAVSVACLDGISPFDFHDVPVTDGVNHPSDTGKSARLAGRLVYIPTVDEANDQAADPISWSRADNPERRG